MDGGRGDYRLDCDKEAKRCEGGRKKGERQRERVKKRGRGRGAE